MIKLLDVYPYPNEYKDYPPYWKYVNDIQIHDDNIGNKGDNVLNLGMRAIIIKDFVYVPRFEYVDRLKTVKQVTGGCAIIGDDNGNLIDLFVICDKEDLLEYKEKDEIVFIGGKSYHNG